VAVLNIIRDCLDALLHPSARYDALTRARHRAFMAPRLLGSLAAFAAFPVYLAMRGAPTALEVAAFAWLIAPILLSWFLSRTGRYEGAHVLSSLALAGLIMTLAMTTGGIESFAAVWLVVVPLEAALSASRRAVVFASALALSCTAVLIACGHFDLLPAGEASPLLRGVFMAFGVASATLYAAGLAFAAESLARTSVALLNVEEDRYRLLARNMSDVISRHRRNGAVQFISPAVETMLGTPVTRLLGHGLFDRVHVADRPAYLTALSDAARGGEARSVEFRLRRGGERGQVDFIWVEMRCRPLEQVAQAASEAEVVAVMRDVTDRKVQEQALNLARTAAEQADAAKTRFLATMSHELRTPLNAIIGFSEMIVQEDALSLDAARRKEYAQLINDSGQHLLSVVNGILDMSKMESGNFEIAPEPFAPRAARINFLKRHRPRDPRSGGSAGHDRRSARVQAGRAESGFQRHQVHRTRRQGDGFRRRRGIAAGAARGRYRRRHRGRRSQADRRPVLPGRQDLSAAARRHRARTVDREKPGWIACRRDISAKQDRRGNHGDGCVAAGVHATA
jgi:cell cycle sensor histidine kinase DivJ